MSDTPPLCHFRHSKSGRRRSIRTDDPSSWIEQGYELVDATHAPDAAVKAVMSKAAGKASKPAAAPTPSE